MNDQTNLPQVGTQQLAAISPMAMIDRAITSGASVETLERLMVLQERWESGEAKREFDEAIGAAKSEIRPIIKNRHVGFESKRTDSRTDYDYEDLPAVAEAVDPILAKYGLSYRFQCKQEGVTVSVTCIVSHRRGHREETTLQASADNSGNKNPIQAIGSAVTYLQRYTLKAALGLSASRDDDARASTDEPKTIDDAQFRYLQDLIEKASADEGKLLAFIKAADLQSLTQAQYKAAETALRKKITSGGK